MSRIIKSLFLLFIVLGPAGCSAINKSTLKSVPMIMPEQNPQANIAKKEERRALNLAVVPFAEKRGKLKSYGSVYKYLIPLLPYGTIRYERPDEAKMFNIQNEFEFNMSENLLEILITAVRNSSLFGEVILTTTPLASRADLILSGDIHYTLYEGKTYSYGISFLGPALWCLGLPAGSSHKRLNIELYLKKIDTGEVFWAYNLNKEKTLVQGLYHNWGKDVNSFANLMQEGVKEAIASLRSRLSHIPFDDLKAISGAPPQPSAENQPELILEPSSRVATANTTDTVTK
ncbi:MAG: hypothetical protein A3J51_01240 [Omnitrophica WOR_2 bacterium RIFCSPHIGHO2_02_FULL_45_21]|nr:MAG: hypothetical protein A3J51_01240 [Omnitrophica WOR_2 bacterium RIFCSPHIGHO2_02_FULL_45_21]